MFNLNSMVVQNKIKRGEITQEMLNRYGTYYGNPTEFNRGSDGLTDQERGYIIGYEEIPTPDEQCPIGLAMVANLRDANEVRAEREAEKKAKTLGNTPEPMPSIPQPQMQYASMPVQSPYFQQQQPQMFQPAGNIPFMSPREMVVNGYHNQAYYPQPQPQMMYPQYQQQNPYVNQYGQPRNIVGAYNPGYQQAFAGYSNPFMGQGSNLGFGYQQQQMMYMDDETRYILYKASKTHKSYMEQLEDENRLYKTMIRIANKVAGKSEEEIERKLKAYDIYDKSAGTIYNTPISRPRVKIHVAVVNEKGEILEDNMTDTRKAKRSETINFELNTRVVEEMQSKKDEYRNRKIQINNYIYDHSVERQMDKIDGLVDFFNNHAWKLVADTDHHRLLEQRRTNAAKMYKQNAFRKNLLGNNGYTQTSQNASERFFGRYGFMPDGRPVSPYNDPSVGSAFSYDPATGVHDIHLPEFMQRNVNRAKNAFFSTIRS